MARARTRVASRTVPTPTDLELASGLPVFLDQLVVALRLAKSSDAVDHEQIKESAGKHGGDLFRLGLTVAQVVHDYGDLCQVITELAVDQSAPISSEEFRLLNLCLDDAIAGAVTEFARERDRRIAGEGNERLGELAHEMRNLLVVVMIAFENIKTGRVSAQGSTSALLERSLGGLRNLIDSALADVRLGAGLQQVERISVAEFIEEIELGIGMLAQSRGLYFVVSPVQPAVTIEGDRQVLVAAVTNLLQNAFKFTGAGRTVSLTTRVTEDRVFFDVEDECGGLPPGKVEELFRPFTQRGTDRRGLGLGLTICRRAAKANGGELRARDLPGKGCIFTLELPRKPAPPLKVVHADGSGSGVPGTKGGVGARGIEPSIGAATL